MINKCLYAFTNIIYDERDNSQDQYKTGFHFNTNGLNDKLICQSRPRPYILLVEHSFRHGPIVLYYYIIFTYIP